MNEKPIYSSQEKSVNATINHTFSEKEKKTQISFSIRSAGKLYFVLVENIAFIYLADEIVYLVDFEGEKHIISKTLDSLEKAVSAQQFYRINRQMIVNRQAVKEVESHTHQRIIVCLSVPMAEKVVVPRLKVRSFLNWIEKGVS